MLNIQHLIHYSVEFLHRSFLNLILLCQMVFKLTSAMILRAFIQDNSLMDDHWRSHFEDTKHYSPFAKPAVRFYVSIRP